VAPTIPEDPRPAAIPAGYTVVAHGGGGGYTVIGPNGEVADGIADAGLAVRTAQAHAAGEPTPTPEPAHTLSLPARCTVGELRALLRQVPASARLADVRILGAEVVASLTDLSELELKFTGGAK